MNSRKQPQRTCAVCQKDDAVCPVNSETPQYCKTCWDNRCALARESAEKVALQRSFRGIDVECYLIFPERGKRSHGEVIAIKERPDFTNLVVLLDGEFDWDVNAYQLDRDPNPETWTDVLTDVLVGSIVESWGGGKWVINLHHMSFAGPETIEGEI